MGNNTSVGETTPYKPMNIARKSALGWNKGTKVILLDDAEGNTWIMKGFQLGLKPQYTYDEFVATAASKFKMLPKGWKVRVKTLEKDLHEKPEGGRRHDHVGRVLQRLRQDRARHERLQALTVIRPMRAQHPWWKRSAPRRSLGSPGAFRR